MCEFPNDGSGPPSCATNELGRELVIHHLRSHFTIADFGHHLDSLPSRVYPVAV